MKTEHNPSDKRGALRCVLVAMLILSANVHATLPSRGATQLCTLPIIFHPVSRLSRRKLPSPKRFHLFADVLKSQSARHIVRAGISNCECRIPCFLTNCNRRHEKTADRTRQSGLSGESGFSFSIRLLKPSASDFVISPLTFDAHEPPTEFHSGFERRPGTCKRIENQIAGITVQR